MEVQDFAALLEDPKAIKLLSIGDATVYELERDYASFIAAGQWLRLSNKSPKLFFERDSAALDATIKFVMLATALSHDRLKNNGDVGLPRFYGMIRDHPATGAWSTWAFQKLVWEGANPTWVLANHPLRQYDSEQSVRLVLTLVNFFKYSELSDSETQMVRNRVWPMLPRDYWLHPCMTLFDLLHLPLNHQPRNLNVKPSWPTRVELGKLILVMDIFLGMLAGSVVRGGHPSFFELSDEESDQVKFVRHIHSQSHQIVLLKQYVAGATKKDLLSLSRKSEHELDEIARHWINDLCCFPSTAPGAAILGKLLPIGSQRSAVVDEFLKVGEQWISEDGSKHFDQPVLERFASAFNTVQHHGLHGEAQSKSKLSFEALERGSSGGEVRKVEWEAWTPWFTKSTIAAVIEEAASAWPKSRFTRPVNGHGTIPQSGETMQMSMGQHDTRHLTPRQAARYGFRDFP
ncbi:hypothetical protein OIO90_004551 [Microbotryomycetes sp. JL221]|nr:hypothetical protein OIO90_004551 [Microbotryomycetes sp. JL221]